MTKKVKRATIIPTTTTTTTSKKKTKIIRTVVEPRSTDVLLGRGNGVATWRGNVYFRKLVWDHRDRYRVAIRFQKMKVATDVLQILTSLSPPGRFVEMIDEDTYVLVEENRALEKICQALREKKIKNRPQDDIRFTDVDWYKKEETGSIPTMTTSRTMTVTEYFDEKEEDLVMKEVAASTMPSSSSPTLEVQVSKKQEKTMKDSISPVWQPLLTVTRGTATTNPDTATCTTTTKLAPKKKMKKKKSTKQLQKNKWKKIPIGEKMLNMKFVQHPKQEQEFVGTNILKTMTTSMTTAPPLGVVHSNHVREWFHPPYYPFQVDTSQAATAALSATKPVEQRSSSGDVSNPYSVNRCLFPTTSYVPSDCPNMKMMMMMAMNSTNTATTAATTAVAVAAAAADTFLDFPTLAKPTNVITTNSSNTTKQEYVVDEDEKILGLFCQDIIDDILTDTEKQDMLLDNNNFSFLVGCPLSTFDTSSLSRTPTLFSLASQPQLEWVTTTHSECVCVPTTTVHATDHATDPFIMATSTAASTTTIATTANKDESHNLNERGLAVVTPFMSVSPTTTIYDDDDDNYHHDPLLLQCSNTNDNDIDIDNYNYNICSSKYSHQHHHPGRRCALFPMPLVGEVDHEGLVLDNDKEHDDDDDDASLLTMFHADDDPMDTYLVEWNI